MEKGLPIEDVTVDYLPKPSLVKRNTRLPEPEPAKYLKKGGIDFVDLASEEESEHPVISRKTRVSMANCQPRYTYEKRTQPDLSVLTANRKASKLESEENHPLPPETLTTRSAIVTAPSHSLLFGSSKLSSSSFDDESLDVALANLSEPVTISSQKIANTSDITVSFESSPPIQHKIYQSQKTEPFMMPSSENSRTQAVDSNNISGYGDTNISNWDTSPGLYLLS